MRWLGLAPLVGSPLARGAVSGVAAHRANAPRVIVIGAGLAGLAAARELQRLGYQPLVLEGRDRIGGRIWTSHHWPDMPLDLGATWIHGVRGNPITDLADEIRAQRLTTSYDRTVTYHTDGQPLDDAAEAQLDAIRARARRALRKAQDREPDQSVRAAVASLAGELASQSESARFLDFILSGEIEQEYAGSAHHLSAHWYDSARELDGADVLFARGFETITHHLARGLRIELSQVVEEIHWGQGEVRVQTQRGQFTAERVIVTLPLGVLQQGGVRLHPQLPEDVREAISALGMGVLNKCYLRFERAFWPADVDWLEYIPPRHGEWTEWVSFQRAAGKPILLGFNAAERGREIEGWSDGRIVASAMETLRTLFGPDIPAPIDYQITRWATDPFARGSYSYNALGSTPRMRKRLARPLEGRLFLAGEATHEHYFGTAHGALLSGLRAAADVVSA